jgi:hypothetical protein
MRQAGVTNLMVVALPVRARGGGREFTGWLKDGAANNRVAPAGEARFRPAEKIVLRPKTGNFPLCHALSQHLIGIRKW